MINLTPPELSGGVFFSAIRFTISLLQNPIQLEMLMILVTGAAGKTGRALTAALALQNKSVRAFVRKEEQVVIARSTGALETVVGDLTRVSDIQRALEGIDTLYFIAPNMNPAETNIGHTIIESARSAGVTKFVYHSVLHPQTQNMPHHWNKLLVEERLFESGLIYSIIQPTAYMQNLLANRQSIMEDGIYQIPYPVNATGNLVDLNDVAEAAVKILTEARFDFGTYEFVGTPALTQEEIAATAASVLGREVRAVELSRDEWRTNAAKTSVLSDYAINTLSAMFKYYADFSLTGSSFVLEAVLGRKPRSLESFFKKWLDN
jgi:uncharacterized protein YbjT (DUF2867 family)